MVVLIHFHLFSVSIGLIVVLGSFGSVRSPFGLFCLILGQCRSCFGLF